MKASVMLEHETKYTIILAFDVRIERDAQELADSLGINMNSVQGLEKKSEVYFFEEMETFFIFSIKFDLGFLS